MLTRLLDPRTGTPRDPSTWLVLAAIVSTQLLAFYAVCNQQVREAEHRRAEAQVQRVAERDCTQSAASSTVASCSVQGTRGNSLPQQASAVTRVSYR